MRKFRIKVDGEEYLVEVEEVGKDTGKEAGGIERKPGSPGSTSTKKKPGRAGSNRTTSRREKDNTPATSKEDVTAPMPGKILEIAVKEGQEVERGETLTILEAMKLENNISAPFSGKVKEILTEVGANVEAGDILIKME